ncbi:hypothetical protein Taro_053736 [Colocasia esculenta]|uniref:Uncharacterized protein n=1 Tax=Colocasia esculenta TaxID=4460 RepID=A0A843XNN5_COLES|nr:hypothetical protein [Colocasia esculenta]
MDAAIPSALPTPHLVLAATLLLVAATFFSGILRRRQKPPQPPGPFALPIIGHLYLLGPKPHQSFHSLCQKYGPVISLRLGSTPVVVAASADAATEFFKTHDLDFADRPQSVASRRFAYDSAGFAFAPYGPYWRFVRKVCMTDLLGGRTLEQLLPVRRRELTNLLGTLMEGARRGEAVDVSRELIRMTNNTIARMTTSRTCSVAEGEESAADPEESMKLVKQVAELIGSFNLTDHVWLLRGWDVQGLNRRIEEVHRGFDAMMERIIRQKEKARKARKEGDDPGVKDLLDLLLDVSEDESADVRLTRENVKGIVLDVFTAGSDSSAVTIEWALAELIHHPAMLEKAKEEVDRVVGRERLAEEADVPGLPYLQAVVKETLRLHPAACFASREAVRDATVSGYRIPAGTALFVNIWSVGKDPKQWDAPLEFRPERFLAGEEAGRHFPFGGGRRICPGAALALQVVQTALAALLQCFEWGQVGKVDMEEGVGLVVPRARPLVCVPAPRLSALPPMRG